MPVSSNTSCALVRVCMCVCVCPREKVLAEMGVALEARLAVVGKRWVSSIVLEILGSNLVVL